MTDTDTHPYKSMSETDREQIRTALSPARTPATNTQILECAAAIRRLRDPNGPSGHSYEQLRLGLARHAPLLIARILEAEAEIERLVATSGPDIDKTDQ